MFRRNHTKELQGSRSQLLRSELGESVDHALRAAGHAVGGVKETVGPLTEAAQAKVTKKLNKVKGKDKAVARRRWPRLAGLLAGGAAVGAAAAFILRRRRQQPWEEYEEQPAAGTEKHVPEPEQPMTSEPAKSEPT